MTDNKSQKILDNVYADQVKEVVDYIVNHDEQAKALELSLKLEKAVSSNFAELKVQPQLRDFYKEAILKLKFICLPALEDKEVVNLIKNNFCFQFRLADYDFFRKMDAKILNIIVVDDRTKFKEDLRRILLENIEKITPNGSELKSVQDWLKNYVSKVGLEEIDKLPRAQYLMALKNDKTVSPQDYTNLSLLFKFYDYLSIPADSPEGFSEEAPVTIDGKLYIFRKGVLEPVLENKELDEVMQELGEVPAGNEPTAALAVTPLADDDLFLKKPAASSAVVSSPATPASQPPSLTAELEQILAKYPPTSLEYKAVNEEIKRLQKADAKKTVKAVKTDVKK